MDDRPRLVTEEVEQGILDAYRRGDPLLAIERTYGVARATVYWLLHRNHVAPSRAKTNTRLKGDEAALAELYRLIEAQDETILAIDGRIREALAWAKDNAPEHYGSLRRLLVPADGTNPDAAST
jgi:hypothetical protein